MSKVAEFLAKAVADESAKNELIGILGDKPFTEATDEQLVKVGELAKKLGFDITVEEVKAYIAGEGEGELDEEALDAVAGGFNWQALQDAARKAIDPINQALRDYRS